MFTKINRQGALLYRVEAGGHTVYKRWSCLRPNWGAHSPIERDVWLMVAMAFVGHEKGTRLRGHNVKQPKSIQVLEILEAIAVDNGSGMYSWRNHMQK